MHHLHRVVRADKEISERIGLVKFPTSPLVYQYLKASRTLIVPNVHFDGRTGRWRVGICGLYVCSLNVIKEHLE